MHTITSTLISMFFGVLALSLTIHFIRVTYAQSTMSKEQRAHAKKINNSDFMY